MKIFTLLLFVSLILNAKSPDTCYSVQLKSFVLKKNSSYDFSRQGYPESCQLFSFSKGMNAVRCGCYDHYREAKKQQSELVSTYEGATIVKTYKYRFAKKLYEKKEEPKSQELQVKSEVQPQKQEEQNIQESSSALEMAASLYDEVLVNGHVALTGQNYSIAPIKKHKENLTASTVLELAYAKENLSVNAKLKAQADYYDFGATEKNRRTYVRLDELYAKYDFSEDQILFGKNIRFWGALELRNIVDGFNPQELRDDPFNMDKLGVWNASYSHFTDSGELSVIVKLYEQEREMAGFPYVYYYFPENYEYNSKLVSEDGQERPTLYLKYSGTLDSEYALDYSFIIQNGYDSQRYYSLTGVSPTKIATQENAYLVNKLSTYNTLAVGATLYKLEALYSDVIDNSVIADYYHLGLGLEHTFAAVYEDADLGVIAEYYNYGTLEKGKRGDLELFELFEDDLFLGLRYSFNKGDDASVLAGAIVDMRYSEQVYFLEYESRLAESFKINMDYRYIEPSPSDLTAFHLMGRHERISLELGYYF